MKTTFHFCVVSVGLFATACTTAAGRKSAEAVPGPPAVRLTSYADNLKPCVVGRPAGGFYLAWAQRSGEKSTIEFARSVDGMRLQPSARVSTAGMQLDLGAESGPDVAVGPHGAVYVAWTAGSVPAPAQSAKPATAAPREKAHTGSHPPRPGNLNIWMATSADDGATFSAPVRVNDDPDGAEHRFPIVRVDSQGAICVAWLDKRTKTSSGEDVARVFFARSKDGGRTFAANVDATAGQANPICHCCRPGLAIDPRLGLLVAYRNDLSDLRDILLTRSPDSGTTFAAPMPLEHTGWKLPNCPMDGPSLGLDSGGGLHAAWMSGARTIGSPKWGAAEPGDSKILYNVVAPNTSSPPEPLVIATGHHPRLVVRKTGETLIVWHDKSLMLARVGSDGKCDEPPVALSDGHGTPSYPSIALDGNGDALVTWQQLMPDDSVQVYLRKIPAAWHAATANHGPQTQHAVRAVAEKAR